MGRLYFLYCIVSVKANRSYQSFHTLHTINHLSTFTKRRLLFLHQNTNQTEHSLLAHQKKKSTKIQPSLSTTKNRTSYSFQVRLTNRIIQKFRNKNLDSDVFTLSLYPHRGVEQLAARWAHNPKVTGSSPVPATKKGNSLSCLFSY